MDSVQHRTTRLPVIQDRPGDRALARDLARLVQGEVRFGSHDRLLYATDASIYQVEPIGVVIPASIPDAVAAARFCFDRGVPVLPRGGGTSLAGQCTNRAVVIDLSVRCRSILGVDEGGRTCRVEPGLAVDELNAELAPRRLFFAPDPATSRHANIGGCIGNNAAGARSIRYGRTSESVLGIDALLSTGDRVMLCRGAAARDPVARRLTRGVVGVVEQHAGQIRRRFPRTIRRNAGYNLDLILDQIESGSGDAEDRVNLAPLLCGSEGTLAMTLGADLLLHPIPRARVLCVAGFESLEAAIEVVGPILRTGPSAVELLDDVVLRIAAGSPEHRACARAMPRVAGGRAPAAVLYVEYLSQTGPEEIRQRVSDLRGVLGGVPLDVHDEGDSIDRAWSLRKAAEPLLHAVSGERKPLTFVEDNAVPVEHLGRFVERFKRIIASHGASAAFFAHASVGVLHVRPLLDLRLPDDRQKMHRIAVEVADLAASLGGVMSGEHGDGRVRSPLLERFYGPELMGAMARIKAVFDPADLLNPGNIVGRRPIESITEHLRLNPGGDILPKPDARTYFQYADQDGFGGAVEMCNGAGLCRKKRGGTMCPSYMALLDERHSTRGRANALRLAITGQIAGGPGPVWNDPETLRTLDLCLSCKACRSECPSGVDVARLKAEYQAQSYRASGGPPVSALVLGHVRALGVMASVAPGLVNAAARSRAGRWAALWALGIDPRRSLPPVGRLARGAVRVADSPPPPPPPPSPPSSPLGRASPGSDRPIVAIFGDCFSLYSEPGIILAAARVIRSLGRTPVVARSGCCGRAMISMGLLEQAIQAGDRLVDALWPWVRSDRVEAIVFLEPSCLSAVVDDLLRLRVHQSPRRRRALADKSMPIERFVLERLEREGAEVSARARAIGAVSQGPPVLFHAHCHERALWGSRSSAEALRRFVGDRLRVLDSGCCGMAGAFGYAQHRFDLSMRIAELSLLPAIRRAGTGAIVLAPGTSCRHQIRDGVGVRARHPIELIDECLAQRA